MHLVLLYAVSLWDIAESGVQGVDMIPRKHWGDPLVLMNVSRRWSQFITSSPPLWSYVLIDTGDDDVLEYLRLSFLLSRNRRLFIVLHGSGDVCGDILVDLLQVGNRIDTLVYPPNVSRSTLAKFRFYFGASHGQPEDICQWSKLEVRSGTQPQGYLRYTFPISTQSLWMSGLFPLSRLVTLSDFQSLSFLSVRISLDTALPPADNYRLELPKLEVLRVQMTLGSDDQVDTPIKMICRNLKLLDLRYTLELDLKNPHKQPANWMGFGEVDGVKDLQIDLAIQEVTEVGSIRSLPEKLPRLERVRRLKKWEQLEHQLEELEKRREREERLERERLERREQREQRERREWRRETREKREQQDQREWEWERKRRAQDEQRREQQQPKERRREQQRKQKEQEQQQQQEKQRQREWQEQQVQYLRFTKSICTHWREWLNLPNSLTHVQQGSLNVTLSTRIHQGTCRVMRNLVEDLLVRSLPQLTELTTSHVLPIFPKHLRKLRFRGFDVSDPPPPITLPSLVSLEIIAESPDHLQVMPYIQVPQLQVLRLQIEDGPGTLHQHDWRHTTNNQLDHISLSVEIPRDKPGDDILVFHLPQTKSFHVSSPHIPLRLYLAKPVPLLYTLNAGLGTMSGPSDGQVGTLSAMWNEEWVTEWINPCGIPSLARFMTLISLQRIVLSQHPYVLFEQSPADTLFELLGQNMDTCPQLNSITLAQCPSSWPRFLCRLRKRNREAMIFKKTKCIEELGFYQPLHATIIRWLVDAIKGRPLGVIEWPPIRKGNAWPMRPFEAEGVFRSCYVCYITGMELGCLEYETRIVDCGRQQRQGSKIFAG